MNRADLFLKEISEEIEVYRSKWKAYFYSRDYTWDDDLLSDTIVKCYDTISRLGLRDGSKESWNYLFKALINNYKRELQYARVKNREEVEDINLLYERYLSQQHTLEHKITSDLLKEFEWNYCLEMAEKYCDSDDFYVFRLQYVLEWDDDKIKKKTKDKDWKKKSKRVVKWLKYNMKKDEVLKKFSLEYPEIDLSILED